MHKTNTVDYAVLDGEFGWSWTTAKRCILSACMVVQMARATRGETKAQSRYDAYFSDGARA